MIDDYNREDVAMETGISFPAERVIRVLTNLKEEIGLPKSIRMDNGADGPSLRFTARKFQSWCLENKIELKFIQPGKPTQNAFIERFNRYFREDILDAYWFEDLEQLRIVTENWRRYYNENHPHKSLGGLSPIQYRITNQSKEKINQKVALYFVLNREGYTANNF